MNRHTPHHRPGIILLVVISSLAFFSILIATYLVYSRDARQSSYNLAARNYRAPEVKDLLDESLMMLVRGTDDPFNPFYGEDLLSDYYGRRDALSLRVERWNAGGGGSIRHIGGGFVRIRVQWMPAAPRPIALQADDLFTGRLVTFTAGPLQNQTFRVLRSRVIGTAPNLIDVLYIQLNPNQVPGGTNLNHSDQDLVVDALWPLFYPAGTNRSTNPAPDGHTLHMNGAPRNSPGLGSDGGDNINQTIGSVADISNHRIDSLPVSLQPNLIRGLDAANKSIFQGDFDEDYDAADFFNWFLSYENPDGTVVPSFHRPAVINYILNQIDWSAASTADVRRALASIARATFRPLPVADGQYGPGIAMNAQFTGSSTKYALRTPLFPGNLFAANANDPPDPALIPRLDQLAKALIADSSDPRNQWDVDSDGDGIKDSIWIDLQLPTFTSPEGKMLKPLIAPRIEDLSARLNLNAHGIVSPLVHVPGTLTPTADPDINSDELQRYLLELDIPRTPGLQKIGSPDIDHPVGVDHSRLATWAGTRAGIGHASHSRTVFRGLGYGPAEITIPGVSVDGIFSDTDREALQTIIVSRYASLYGDAAPGRPSADPLDVLRTGWRPPMMTAGGGYGHSLDPFGRGGVALGRSGNLVAAVSGTPIATNSSLPLIRRANESINDPYESDPSGRLGGDSLYSFAELEPLLRSNDFDIDLLPQRLRSRLEGLLQTHPEFAAVFTTHSKSDDTPISANTQGASAYVSLLDEMGIAGLTRDQINELIAPELRLGRKLDINRPFGNGIDDTPAVAGAPGVGVVDEPRETPPGIWLPQTSGSPLALGSAFNVNSGLSGFMEGQAIVDSTGGGQQIPSGYQTTPRYDFVQVDNFDPDSPPSSLIFELGNPALGRQVTPRQLLARHLYVMMMFLTRGYDFPAMAETLDPPRVPSGTHNANLFKARRIAQWAVNVVDYRDNDSIMTRFVFDPDPFDGWNPLEEPVPEEYVVWGIEAPELIFSESLALHDVRVRNTDRDNGVGTLKPKPGSAPEDIDPTHTDVNTDQVRKPEGSLFLELYCPRPLVRNTAEGSTMPGLHRELYNFDSTTGYAELDLDREAPPRPGAPKGAPVWRIAISERHDADSPKAGANPQLLRNQIPDSYSFDAQQGDELRSSDPALSLRFDRYIWFGDYSGTPEIEAVINGNGIRGSGTDLMQPHAVFFAPSRDLRESKDINVMRNVTPGQYLAIAPREVTYIGSRRSGAEPGQPGHQRFTVVPGEGLVHMTGDDRITPSFGLTQHHMPAVPLIVGAPRPTMWSVPTPIDDNEFEDGYIGLNVSEPLPVVGQPYYPQPSARFNGDEDEDGSPEGVDFPLYDAYLDYMDPDSEALDAPADVEFNSERIPNDGNEPVLGTVRDYCTAFLQRLADPTVPYDPLFNPYRTVDSIAIDLTVFSGEEEATTVNDTNAGDLKYAQRSRQRTGRVGDVQANILFSYHTNTSGPEEEDDESYVGLNAANENYFSFAGPDAHFNSSLSFLNTDTLQSAGTALPPLQSRSNPNFKGFASSIGSEGAPGVTGTERNLPIVPFALHPWLNRPFASHFELMMVPACSQGRLFEEFSINLSGGDVPIYPDDPADAATFYAPFRHLLNFFHSGRSETDAANFARLFDFVHTLPRFKGEVEMIHPDRLNLEGTTFTGASNDPFFRSLLRPPFNLDYDNQRLGRINLNTVSQFPVWAGLMQGHLNANEFNSVNGAANENQFSFTQFIESRRGYAPSPLRTVSQGGNINYDPGNLSHLFPTQFVGTYRNVTSSLFTPVLQDAGASNILRRREANAGLLRVSGQVATSDPPNGTSAMISQFVRGQSQIPNDAVNLPHLDRNRSAFLRYQTLMRMPNLVSDNSQLYLIRLTMGFFEVDANTGSLGREYNEDLGQNKRYKAMYIIDRSKEVGFIPGQDLNARDVVLYESYSQ